MEYKSSYFYACSASIFAKGSRFCKGTDSFSKLYRCVVLESVSSDKSKMSEQLAVSLEYSIKNAPYVIFTVQQDRVLCFKDAWIKLNLYS